MVEWFCYSSNKDMTTLLLEWWYWRSPPPALLFFAHLQFQLFLGGKTFTYILKSTWLKLIDVLLTVHILAEATGPPRPNHRVHHSPTLSENIWNVWQTGHTRRRQDHLQGIRQESRTLLGQLGLQVSHISMHGSNTDLLFFDYWWIGQIEHSAKRNRAAFWSNETASC